MIVRILFDREIRYAIDIQNLNLVNSLIKQCLSRECKTSSAAVDPPNHTSYSSISADTVVDHFSMPSIMILLAHTHYISIPYDNQQVFKKYSILYI